MTTQGSPVTIQPRTHSKMAQKAGKMKKTVTVFVAFHLFMKKRVRPVAKPASMPRKSESRTTAVTAMGAFMPPYWCMLTKSQWMPETRLPKP